MYFGVLNGRIPIPGPYETWLSLVIRDERRRFLIMFETQSTSSTILVPVSLTKVELNRITRFRRRRTWIHLEIVILTCLCPR